MVFLAVKLEPCCSKAENETDITQREAGKQAQPALPGVTIWPCLMANHPAAYTYTNTVMYPVSLLCSPVFLFLSLKR